MRTTYARILPPEYLAQLSVDERTDHWRRVLPDNKSAEFVFVAYDPATKVVGLACGGPERTGDHGFSGELWCIYLLLRDQRRVGTALVSAVAGRLAEPGHASMMVWVLADNPSRLFYEALGGTFVTDKMIELGGKSLVEVAYGWQDLRPLVAANSSCQ